MYIKTDSDGYIVAYSNNFHLGPGEIIVENVPDNLDFSNIHLYKYIDGVFIYPDDVTESVYNKAAMAGAILSQLSNLSSLVQQFLSN